MLVENLFFYIGAVSKVKNFLTARYAKATQRAQYVDNQNYHFVFLAISLRPLQLKILLIQPRDAGKFTFSTNILCLTAHFNP
jgi:hypothetical protein